MESLAVSEDSPTILLLFRDLQSETVWDLWLPDLGVIKDYFIHLAKLFEHIYVSVTTVGI